MIYFLYFLINAGKFAIMIITRPPINAAFCIYKGKGFKN
tara:strand:+ start:4043 stop:4159 length:117 start_codon:yes stop_codon:yes gene_type:complete